MKSQYTRKTLFPLLCLASALISVSSSAIDLCPNCPPCGVELGNFEGIPIRSNGMYTGTAYNCQAGADYQCVYFAVTYFQTKFGFAWPVKAAADLFDYPPADKTVAIFNDGSGAPPRVGDMLVWRNSKYGHVAIISAVGPDYVEVAEQNTRTGAFFRFSFDGKTIKDTPPRGAPFGWIHANNNDPITHLPAFDRMAAERE